MALYQNQIPKYQEKPKKHLDQIKQEYPIKQNININKGEKMQLCRQKESELTGLSSEFELKKTFRRLVPFIAFSIQHSDMPKGKKYDKNDEDLSRNRTEKGEIAGNLLGFFVFLVQIILGIFSAGSNFLIMNK